MTNLEYIRLHATDNDIAFMFSQIAGFNFINFDEGFTDEIYNVLNNYIHEATMNKTILGKHDCVRAINRFLSLKYDEKEWKRLINL